MVQIILDTENTSDLRVAGSVQEKLDLINLCSQVAQHLSSNLIEQCITSSIVATVTAQNMYDNVEDIKEDEFVQILQTSGMLKKGDE